MPTPRHIIINLPEVQDKERILKASKEKQLVTCKRTPIRPLSAYFLAETWQASGEWDYIFKVLKGNTKTGTQPPIKNTLTHKVVFQN